MQAVSLRSWSPVVCSETILERVRLRRATVPGRRNHPEHVRLMIREPVKPRARTNVVLLLESDTTAAFGVHPYHYEPFALLDGEGLLRFDVEDAAPLATIVRVLRSHTSRSASIVTGSRH